MADDLDERDLAILRSLAAIKAEGEAPTAHAVAQRSRVTIADAAEGLNRLWQARLVTPSLALTEAGEQATAREPAA